MILVMIKRWFFPVQSATTSWPQPLLAKGPLTTSPCLLPVVTLHKIKDPYIYKKREPAKLLHHRIRRLCLRLLLARPQLLSWRQLRLEQSLWAAWGDEQVVARLWSSFLWRQCHWTWSWWQRKLLSWNMYKRGKTMFAQELVFAPWSSSSLLKLWSSILQVFVKFSHNDGDEKDWSQYQNSWPSDSLWCS